LLPVVLPLPDAPPEGDVGAGVVFFGWLEVLPLAEPLALPDGLLEGLVDVVPPLPAGRFWSRSQPDNSVPASAKAKAIERIRFMSVAPFQPLK
jgi:hypothetical protein